MIDCVKVYGKAKDVFGWPDTPPDPPLALSKGVGGAGAVEAGGGEKAEWRPFISAKPLTTVDR